MQNFQGVIKSFFFTKGSNTEHNVYTSASTGKQYRLAVVEIPSVIDPSTKLPVLTKARCYGNETIGARVTVSPLINSETAEIIKAEDGTILFSVIGGAETSNYLSELFKNSVVETKTSTSPTLVEA